MRILFDITHPAHLHFFRHAARRLVDEGHRVKFTGRNKDILVQLAAELQVDIEVFGGAGNGLCAMTKDFLHRQRRLRKVIRQFKPDVMAAVAGTYTASLGWLFRIPTYVFYDTEHARLSNLLAYPFATCVYIPESYRDNIRWRHERYAGYHELAYLHPNHFTPDPAVLQEAGLSSNEHFSLVRFVGWGAAHDVGLRGFATEAKIRAIHQLQQYGRVFISSEGPLPEELEPYRLKLSLSRIHDLMAYASLIFGESATMCSEGAVLGVPGVYVDPVGRGYTDEQEQKYGLVHNFTPEQQDEAITKAVEILENVFSEGWQAKRQRLLNEKIDVTDMICSVMLERPYT